LPTSENRVSLDPNYVDEYGIPVARIARKFGPNETSVNKLGQSYMSKVFDAYKQKGALEGDPLLTDAILPLVGDHQMGTCRMGDDPTTSVVNRFGRWHDGGNVLGVNCGFMPTVLAVNPV